MKSFSVLILFVILSLCGLVVLPLIPVQLLPDTHKPMIRVNFSWNEAAPIAVEEINTLLTGALNSLPNLLAINSESYRGGGRIELSFDKDTDMRIAQYEVSSMLRNCSNSFPEQMSYPRVSIGASNEDESPVLVYALLTANKDSKMREYAEDNFVKNLSKVSGVESVTYNDNASEHLQITYDKEKMNQIGLTANYLSNIIQQSEKRFSLGNIKFVKDGIQLQQQAVLQRSLKNGIDWKILPIAVVNNRLFYLGDVAKYKLAPTVPNSYYRINGMETNYLIIYAKQEENQLSVAESVKEQVKEVVLPKGAKLLLVSDPTKEIKKQIMNIFKRAGFTILILLSIIFIFTRSYRYLAVILLSLIANLAIAFFCYYLLGITFHLYSLAGISISITLMIDSVVVMSDHLSVYRNKKVFLAILASVLTTIAALSVVFTLSERFQTDLSDFVTIIIINLSISLFISLFMVPSLFEQLRVTKNGVERNIRRLKIGVKFRKAYISFILKLSQYKNAVIGVVVLMFGIPIFLLPSKLPSGSFMADCYNSVFSNVIYTENVKEPLEIMLGGTLRLFLTKVNHQSYFKKNEETKLYLTAYMPKGSTAQQTNEVILKVEKFLSSIPNIKQFDARINENGAKMTIEFIDGIKDSYFPSKLKVSLSNLIVSFGSVEWELSGVGEGFNNILTEKNTNYRIKMVGYSYVELLNLSEMVKDSLKENHRISDVKVSESGSDHDKSELEYLLRPKKEFLALTNSPFSEICEGLKQQSHKNDFGGVVQYNGKNQEMYVRPSVGSSFTMWDLNNQPLFVNGKLIRPNAITTFATENPARSIKRYNQKFELWIKYNFLGSQELAKEYEKDLINATNRMLPLGYRMEANEYFEVSDQERREQWLSIVIIVAVIFFICSIVFESLLQPLVIILLIPVNFIGVFLTYYCFNISFNNGGYAALILLSGLTVNSVIYILNDRNNDHRYREKNMYRKTDIYAQKMFAKKIIGKSNAIILGVCSSTVGLLPFLFTQDLDEFWLTLLTGTIGGMLFSLLVTFLLLPICFTTKKNEKLI